MKPIVVYDGTCNVCTSNLAWLRRLDWLNVFDAVPYQDHALYERFPALDPLACANALHVVLGNGAIHAGADAIREICLRMPLAAPIGLLIARVAKVVGKNPLMIRLPIFLHATLATLFELSMKIPLLARAQLQILTEGIVQPLPYAETLPEDLEPRLNFTEDQIRKGLPPPKGFRLGDLRWF